MNWIGRRSVKKKQLKKHWSLPGWFDRWLKSGSEKMDEQTHQSVLSAQRTDWCANIIYGLHTNIANRLFDFRQSESKQCRRGIAPLTDEELMPAFIFILKKSSGHLPSNRQLHHKKYITGSEKCQQIAYYTLFNSVPVIIQDSGEFTSKMMQSCAIPWTVAEKVEGQNLYRV